MLHSKGAVNIVMIHSKVGSEFCDVIYQGEFGTVNIVMLHSKLGSEYCDVMT